jgi:prolyl-tRNA synthetase
MMDAYSFHADEEDLDREYEAMRAAYARIFDRCGLTHAVVEADTGTIGGKDSHEFMVLADSGEDAVVICGGCGYAANVEKAEVRAAEQESAAGEPPIWWRRCPPKKTVEEVAAFLRFRPRSSRRSCTARAGPRRSSGRSSVNDLKLGFLGARVLELAGTRDRRRRAPVGYLGPVGLRVSRAHERTRQSAASRMP